MGNFFAWSAWGVLTATAAAVGAMALPPWPGAEETSTLATMYLPGETSHGHYQIELKCSACHTPLGGVREESCDECHAADLKATKDTHPRKKFTPIDKLHLAKEVDGRKCVTCHREHVPDRTLEMSVTLPEDHCIACHEDVADDRPSHEGMGFDTCQNAGCHNFHDNGALNEKYLDDHFGEEELHGPGVVPQRSSLATVYDAGISLTTAEHDGPADSETRFVEEWAASRHALAGVNCSGCHERNGAGETIAWSDSVPLETCASCHNWQFDRWGNGRHGMKYAAGLGPMTPELARLPMHADAAHRELSCNVCHDPHATDTRHAAADACLQCHNDEHSRNYVGTGHHELWLAELAGAGEPGSGVSCATCHMPRVERPDGTVGVDHNQNHNLRPNEKMVKSVCANCHGLQFSLDSLADPQLAETCYEGRPSEHIESVDMARAWFDAKRKKRAEADARKAAAKAAREKRKAERAAAAAAGEA